MKKIGGTFKLVAFILIVVELALIAAFGILYFENVFQLKERVSVEIIYAVAATLIGLDIVFVWVSVLVFSIKRKSINNNVTTIFLI